MWEIYFGHARRVLAVGEEPDFSNLEIRSRWSEWVARAESRRGAITSALLACRVIVYEHSYSRSFDTSVS